MSHTDTSIEPHSISQYITSSIMKVLNTFMGSFHRIRRNQRNSHSSSNSNTSVTPSTTKADRSLWQPFDEIRGSQESIVEHIAAKSSTSTHHVQDTIIHYIAQDHQILQHLVLQCKSKKQDTLLSSVTKKQLLHAIQSHLLVSTSVLQPIVSLYIPDSQRWCSHIGQEYHEIQMLCLRLQEDEKSEYNEKEKEKVWKKLYEAIEKHISDEEHVTLMWLHRECTYEQLRQLGMKYQLAKKSNSNNRIIDTGVDEHECESESKISVASTTQG